MKNSYYGQRFGKWTVIDSRESKLKEKVLCKCDCGTERMVMVDNLLSGDSKSCGCSKLCNMRYFGNVYGKLTVVDARIVNTRSKILCKCECGKEKMIDLHALLKGSVTSCGRCSRIKDISGKRFGNLTAIKFLRINNNSSAVWECECDCGNIIEKTFSELNTGKAIMCSECRKINRVGSIVGERFGKLTVEEYCGIKKNSSLWKCRCDCGKYKVVKRGALTSGNTTSCGCERGARPKDISGKMIGYLEPIKLSAYEKSCGVMWECLCHRCGRTKIISAADLNGGRIISCGCASSSGEEKIKEILDTFSIKFVAQKRFSDCKDKNPLPFDVYIPDKNICIEYDGIGHYEPIKYFGGKKRFEERKRHDSIKTKYCEDNNIKLIRIPYFEFENIEKILREQNAIR